MTVTDPIAAVREALRTGSGLTFAPIRHHSPACAWAVRALIREVKPSRVLIEAPEDLSQHLALLTHPETRAPVAIVALTETARADAGAGGQVAAYYPFCAHAPEYVAVQEAHAQGAEVRFIDLPVAGKLALRPATQNDNKGDTLVSLAEEAPFNSGDYIRAVCERTGCRDGHELWDHLFETRLATPDWRSFLADVGAYCAGIRASTAPAEIERNGDAAREAHMAQAIRQALEEQQQEDKLEDPQQDKMKGTQPTGPIVVVTGGFHTPALMDLLAKAGPQEGNKTFNKVNKTASKKAKAAPETRSYLIRYSFGALDALNGYAAGLPQPAYYDLLWQRAQEHRGEALWRTVALDLIAEFARRARLDGHPINTPQQVEMARIAEGLARLRGRPGALRHDLIDAARSALTKGEAGVRDAWTERLILFLRGEAIGDIPASAGSPPLVEHARALARQHRIDVSDGALRHRSLDIRRKDTHLAASRYLHAMTLLGTSFARRESGPDYLSNSQTELLFEEWSYAWSPGVEGRLIELAARADRLDAACLYVLKSHHEALKAEGHGTDIAALADLIAQGVLAGLGRDLMPLVSELSAGIQSNADFSSVAATLRRLHHLTTTAGPLRAPPELDLASAASAGYRRLIYLCDDLPRTSKEAAPSRVEALRIMLELLNADSAGVFDRSLFDTAIDRIAGSHPCPEILGAVLGMCVQGGRRDPEDLVAALRGQFGGTVLQEEDRLGILQGLLQVAPQVLWRTGGVLGCVDEFLQGLEEDAFLRLLPHLRLAFTALNPREIEQLAGRIALLRNASAGELLAVHHTLSQGDLQRGLALEAALRAQSARDGLATWLLGEKNA